MVSTAACTGARSSRPEQRAGRAPPDPALQPCRRRRGLGGRV